MSEPTQTCELCGRYVTVNPYARGFPPDAAKRTLVKVCKANDCPSKPRYTAGFSFGTRVTGMDAP